MVAQPDLVEETLSNAIERTIVFERGLRTWRARLSVPALLASQDERNVVAAVTAVNGASCILSISLVAWLFDLPLLFPALGPTAFILFATPFSPDAAPRSVALVAFPPQTSSLTLVPGVRIPIV